MPPSSASSPPAADDDDDAGGGRRTLPPRSHLSLGGGSSYHLDSDDGRPCETAVRLDAPSSPVPSGNPLLRIVRMRQRQSVGIITVVLRLTE